MAKFQDLGQVMDPSKFTQCNLVPATGASLEPSTRPAFPQPIVVARVHRPRPIQNYR